MLYRPHWMWVNTQLFPGGCCRCFMRLCPLLSEKTSVGASIAPVRRWVCLTCRACASLTGAVTSTKTRASRWLSRLPMSSDTGKEPRKLRSLCRVHVAMSGRRNGSTLNGAEAAGLHCGLELTLLHLCFLTWNARHSHTLSGPSTSSALSACTICITPQFPELQWGEQKQGDKL